MSYAVTFGVYCECGNKDSRGHPHIVRGVQRDRWMGWNYCRWWGGPLLNVWVGRWRLGVWDTSDPDTEGFVLLSVRRRDW